MARRAIITCFTLVLTCCLRCKGLRVEDAESQGKSLRTMGQDGSARLHDNGSLEEVDPVEYQLNHVVQLDASAVTLQGSNTMHSQASVNNGVPIENSAAESNVLIDNTLYKSKKDIVLLGNATLLTACIVALVACPLGPIGYAFITMIVWGVDMFALGYVNVVCPHPFLFLVGKFIATGIEGVILHVYNKVYDSNYQKDLQMVADLGILSRLLFCLVPGFALFFGDILTVTGFGLDVEATGVNGMIVCLSPAIVALFFYLVAAEKPSRMQLQGGALALGGGLMSAIVGVKDGESAVEQMGLLWCTLAMLFYAVVMILMRYASIRGVTWKPLWASRCVALGIGGFMMLATYPLLHTEIPSVSWKLVVWTLLATAADELGLYSLAQSFQCPGVKAGVQSAFGSSCVLINIILGWILLDHQQPLLKYLAAGTSFVGIIILAVG